MIGILTGFAVIALAVFVGWLAARTGVHGLALAMFLEHVEGLGKAIMRNFVFAAPDCFVS